MKRSISYDTSNKKPKLEIDIDSLICPISRQIFNSPVLANDGIFYEEECIKSWLEINNRSPLTGQIMSTQLFPSVLLKNEINELIIKYPELKNNRYEINKTYTDNKSKIRNIILNNNLEKLTEYTDYDLLDYLFNDNQTFMKIFISKCTDINIFQYIIDNSIDINCIDRYQYSFMDLIALHSNLDIFKFGLRSNLPFNRSLILDYITTNEKLNKSVEAYKLILQYNNIEININNFTNILTLNDDELSIIIFNRMHLDDNNDIHEWICAIFTYGSPDVKNYMFNKLNIDFTNILPHLESSHLNYIIDNHTIDDILKYHNNGLNFNIEYDCTNLIHKLLNKNNTDIITKILNDYDGSIPEQDTNKNHILFNRMIYSIENYKEIINKNYLKITYEFILQILNYINFSYKNKREIIIHILNVFKNNNYLDRLSSKNDLDEYDFIDIIMDSHLNIKNKIYICNYFLELIEK